MRKLTLRKEVLTELTPAELTHVVAGVETQICPTDPCITPPPSQFRCTFSIFVDFC